MNSVEFSDKLLDKDQHKVERPKIDSHTTDWKTQSAPCNLCHTDNPSTLWIKDGFRYVRCQTCGLVYVNPQLLSSEIERIYAIGYKSKSASKPRPVDFLAYQPVLSWAAPYKQAGRLLDVGCFKGYLLVAAREQGWAVFGTEISSQAVDYARREHQLDVVLGSLPEAGYPGAYFDVIIMQDVIEHLSDPSNYLREICRLLRPGGGLYLDTPNFDSLTRHALGKDWSVFFPWHQYYFTVQTLCKMVEIAGLTVRHVQCIGLSPLSRYNAFRSLESRGEIADNKLSGLKALIRKRAPFVRRWFFVLKDVGNLCFKLASALGIHSGSKMIVMAEKPSTH